MKKYTNNIIGKTIKTVHPVEWSNYIIIIFTDGTFCEIESEQGYDGCVEPPEVQDRSSTDIDTLILIGLMSKEEGANIKEAQVIEALKDTEKRERNIYEKLKKKFKK